MSDMGGCLAQEFVRISGLEPNRTCGSIGPLNLSACPRFFTKSTCWCNLCQPRLRKIAKCGQEQELGNNGDQKANWATRCPRKTGQNLLSLTSAMRRFRLSARNRSDLSRCATWQNQRLLIATGEMWRELSTEVTVASSENPINDGLRVWNRAIRLR
jgi:hypothetical protein